MKVTIEKFFYSNPRDRKVLQACLRAWFRDPRELNFIDPRMSYPFDFRQWNRFSYQADNIVTLVLKQERWIVGYLSVRFHPGKKQAHFFHLFITPERRRQGLAIELLTAAVQLTKDRKMDHITLHVVAVNKRAQKIYSEFGFVTEGPTKRGTIRMGMKL